MDWLGMRVRFYRRSSGVLLSQAPDVGYHPAGIPGTWGSGLLNWRYHPSPTGWQRHLLLSGQIFLGDTGFSGKTFEGFTNK